MVLRSVAYTTSECVKIFGRIRTTGDCNPFFFEVMSCNELQSWDGDSSFLVCSLVLNKREVQIVGMRKNLETLIRGDPNKRKLGIPYLQMR